MTQILFTTDEQRQPYFDFIKNKTESIRGKADMQERINSITGAIEEINLQIETENQKREDIMLEVAKGTKTENNLDRQENKIGNLKNKLKRQEQFIKLMTEEVESLVIPTDEQGEELLNDLLKNESVAYIEANYKGGVDSLRELLSGAFYRWEMGAGGYNGFWESIFPSEYEDDNEQSQKVSNAIIALESEVLKNA